MIRPFTLITMAMAMASGAYLFAVKHRAQVLDDQLAAVTQNARLDQQRIRVLQAQWALEIDPKRLNQLAAQFSPLQPMKAAQLVTLAALPGLLPAPGSAAPAENPVAQAMPLVAANDVSGPAAPDASVVAMLPMPPPEAPGSAMNAASVAADQSQTVAARGVPSPDALRAILSAKPAASRGPKLASVTRRGAASHLAHSELAENLPPPRPLFSQAAADNAPMGARVMSVSATPMAAAANDAQGGSMLGMAADLAPPLPIAQGTGN